jgi:ribosomal protein L14
MARLCSIEDVVHVIVKTRPARMTETSANVNAVILVPTVHRETRKDGLYMGMGRV